MIDVPKHPHDDERVAVVVGLGNPGKRYEGARHNAGFQVADELAHRFHIHLQERKFRASWGAGVIQGQRILIFKPLTYMNLSGEAVKEMLNYFGISSQRMLVIHDDLDLSCGRLKIARRGGAAGHRGVLSIIEHLRNQDFPRLKLGVGRPLEREPVEAYVLQKPYPHEAETFEEMLALGAEAVQTILSLGLEEAMNRFNRQDPQSVKV
jgi:PTH1 family peptidyl-tRNA hydrolase